MKIGDRVEVTRTYFARNEACTNWGRECSPTQGIVEFVSNRWVTLMMISPKDSKKKTVSGVILARASTGYICRKVLILKGERNDGIF